MKNILPWLALLNAAFGNTAAVAQYAPTSVANFPSANALGDADQYPVHQDILRRASGAAMAAYVASKLAPVAQSGSYGDLKSAPLTPLASGSAGGSMPGLFLQTPSSPIATYDLVTPFGPSGPPNGHYSSGDAAPIDFNPLLGPFLPAGQQITQDISYVTTPTTLSPGVGLYGRVQNFHAISGYDPTNPAIETNFGLFTYAEGNSGKVWGIANDLQLGIGANLINAYTQEIDLVNYRGDYSGFTGGAAVGLQMFFGGPHRSTAAISIGSYGGAPSDPANLVDGISFGGSQLISGSTVLDDTNSATSYQILGSHGIGIDMSGASSTGFQVKGVGWNVNPSGVVTAPSFVGTIQTPTSSSAPCTTGQFVDDANYHYVCTAPNHWRRVAYSDF